MKKILLSTIFLVLFGTSLAAHHAMEYIEMESYSTAKKGEFVAHLHYDYFVENQNNYGTNHWEITPGLSYGFLDRLMGDIHTHFAKFNEITDPNKKSPMIEAVAMALQFRVTDTNQLPVDIAVAGFFEIPTKRSQDLLDGSYAGGASLILGWNWGIHNNITANFIYERDGDENVFAWAIGAKFVMSTMNEHAPGVGIELLGDFKGHLAIMPGFYIGLTPTTTLKIGVSFGFSRYIDGMKNDDDKEADLRAHTSIMKRW